MLDQLHRQVQAGLAAERRQQRVGALGFDHFFDNLPSERLDVSAIGRSGIGHDRGRIGIHQHDFVALFAQRLTGLRAGIIETRRLGR